MPSSATNLGELLTPEETARYLRTTVASLAQERYGGRGPKYIRVGRRIRYRASDIAAYLDANTVAM